ncbi:MAG: hypothetical protein N3D11_06995 [Candidatus Sumerlaeia bacterium]|nr:hypothetical protein [Candidatus Sumerlaeia bacterium]
MFASILPLAAGTILMGAMACGPQPPATGVKKPGPTAEETPKAALSEPAVAKTKVFEAVDFQNVTGGRVEPQYKWAILFGQYAGFTLPVDDLKPGPYRVSIYAQNHKVAPVLMDIVEAGVADSSATALAEFAFELADNTFSTVTKTIELPKGVSALRVRFTNDTPVGAPEDRNAAVRRVVLTPAGE